jgi:hypothetical protein
VIGVSDAGQDKPVVKQVESRITPEGELGEENWIFIPRLEFGRLAYVIGYFWVTGTISLVFALAGSEAWPFFLAAALLLLVAVLVIGRFRGPSGDEADDLRRRMR